MTQVLSPPLKTPRAEQGEPPFDIQPTARTALLVLALLLVSNGPLFVCMPLTNDTAFYDLQARVMVEGGVLYRDILEPNLPGVVWIHAAVRSVLGSSSEAMRIFDLTVFGAIVWMLTRWLAARGGSAAAQAWTACTLVLFYFSISEWSHCQRDVWLLAPALAALHLRRRQAGRVVECFSRETFVWAVVEGAVWGCGVWLKPMVAVPALVAWLAGAAHVRRLRPILLDLAGLLAGGLLVGGLGLAWMWLSGVWPHFWEVVLEWNPRYFAAGKEHWTVERFLGMAYRFFPWLFLHLIAVPCAMIAVVGWLRSRTTEDDGPLFARGLLAAFYLAWLAQSFFLQHLYDYIHAPGILLAVAILAMEPLASPKARTWRLAAACFLGLAVFVSPAFRSDRLAAWDECVTQGSTPEVRKRLGHSPYPAWDELRRVADYLHGKRLRDGELTCFNNNMIYLYNELDLRPSTRYAYLETALIFFPERRSEIHAALAASPQKYLVTDMTAAGLAGDDLLGGAQGENGQLPPAFPESLKRRFPWSYPIAFRAGSLLVHRVPPEPQNSSERQQQ